MEVNNYYRITEHQICFTESQEPKTEIAFLYRISDKFLFFKYEDGDRAMISKQRAEILPIIFEKIDKKVA